MATQIGVIKQVSGLVVAIDENGTQRVLKAGDALFLGEVIKTSSAASKAVVSMDNGKDVTILGNESVKLDNSVLANSDNTVADVSDLQKALLDGKDLTKLEETAAGGGNAAAGGGDGVSLGAATFEHGGHYSNINENFRSISETGGSTGAGQVGGVSGGATDNANGKAIAGDSTPSAKPEVTADPQNGGVSVKPDPTAEKDSKTKIDYTDESGDPKEVTYTKGDDGKWHKDPSNTNPKLPETSDDNGVIKIPGTEIKDNSEVVANTTDPSGNESEKGKAIAGDSTAPTYKPEISFVDDNDGNGTLNKAEIGNDGKTEAKITVPSNANIGDSIVYTVNGGQEKTEKITQEIKDNGFTVEVPVTDGQKATVTAKVVDPAGNAGDKSEASIDVDLTALAIDKIIDDVQGGKFNEDVKGGLTNDNTPTIVGTAKAGTRVEIYDNDVKIGEALADSNNEWTFTPATSLKDGEHKFIAKANGDSSAATVTIDATMKIEFSVDLTVSDSSKPGAGAAPIFVKEQTTDKSDLLMLNGNLTNKTVDLKGGNDDLFVGGRVIGNSVINAGEGNDRINIDNSLGGVAGRGTVNLGDGGNVKVVKTHIHGKTSDANTDYIVKGENGNVIYRGTTDSNGNFGAWIANVVKPGEKITVEMTDKAGNSGKASSKAHTFNSDGSRYYNNELLVGTDIHNGKVTAGDGNDKVDVGTKGGSKHITSGSNINLGNGDNELIVGTNIDHSRVETGSGDDIVKVGGYIWNASGKIAGTNEEYGIYLGDGNNQLTVSKNIDNSNVTTGSGNDVVTVGGYITNHSNVNLGDGDNQLIVGTNIAGSHVTAGDGDDVVTVGQWQHTGDSWISAGSIVDLGNGNNKLTVGTNIDSSTVTTGSGDDVIKVGGYVTKSTINLGSGDDTINISDYFDSSTLTTGAGDDKVTIGGSIKSTVPGKSSFIDLGDGNDTISVSNIENGKIDGGAGYDILSITNPSNTIDLSSIAKQADRFEELNISNGQAGTTLKIGLKDVVDLTDDNNILKISGDAGDAVSFKDSGWSKGSSSNGYTSYTNVNTDGKTVTIQIEDEIIRPM